MTLQRLLADDPDDQLLVTRVAPRDRKNPRSRPFYHLVVIGAGPAGLVAAAGARGLGASVALVERELMGGDCLNFGCVPSKALLGAAARLQEAKSSAAFGVNVDHVRFELDAALSRLRRVRSQLAVHDSVARFEAMGVDVFLGAGRFANDESIQVADEILRFKRALIATGARARVPDMPGIEQVAFHTNETIFSLTKLPERLIVLGGGPVGCELSQAFARLGVGVDLVERADRLLVREAPDAAQLIARQLERDGVHLWLGASATRCEPSASGVRMALEGVSIDCLEANALLIAVGRQPSVAALDLERAGVEYDEAGVRVDDFLRTTNPAIYAAGDVCAGLPQFTHAADAMTRIALQNALFFGHKRVSDLCIPRVTYTSPALAHVGMGHDEARRDKDKVQEFMVPLAELDRSVIDERLEGFARVYLDQKRGTLLGATMVGEQAGECIAELSLAVTHRLSVAQLAATVHPYPTQSEAWKRVADAWSRSRLTPWAKRLFALWFRWFRR